MKKIWVPVFAAFTFIAAVAQDSETVLMTIGDTKVTKGEFEYIFNKNKSAAQDEPTTLKEYVDMFTKFKLKVIEAESRGMDTTASFTKELTGYRAQLAKPYMIDQKLSDELIEDAYFRMSHEVNASHILLRLPQHPRPADTLKVYNKIMDLRNKALNGEDFAELAAQNSEDPSAKTNGGNLNYFSGFMMVGPFEDAAFSTPIGEISMPVRTRYGYHIVKVHDVRESRGEVKVAHILFLRQQDMTPEDLAQLETKAKEAYAEVKENPDKFGDVAREMSDDHASANDGGKMGWFSTGQMVYEFQEKAFSMEIGEISEPFESRFGWHIVKKLDARPYASFEDKKEEVKKMLARTDRGKQPEESFINKRKKEYGYTVHEDNLKAFIPLSKQYNYNDTAFVTATRGMDAPVITLDSVDVTFTQQDFADYLVTDSRMESPNEEVRVNTKFDRYARKSLKDFEDTQLERKYPEFRYLMQEYHDGILLFEISQEEVWNKAGVDTTGLENFYKKNKKKYPWETEHYVGKVYYCTSDSVKTKLEEMLSAGKHDTSIVAALNVETNNVDIEDGIFKPGDNAAVDSLVFSGVSSIDVDGRFITGVAPGTKYKAGVPKELELVRGSVISDYQDYLEESWVKALRKKYKVKVDKKVLETVEIKEIENN